MSEEEACTARAEPPFTADEGDDADGGADFDATFERALALGVLTEAMFDRLTDAIARGHRSEREVLSEWAPRVACPLS